MRKKIFKITQEKGELNFGVFWISLDGRLMTKWYQTYKEALHHYFWLKNLKRHPSLNIRIEEKWLKNPRK